MSQLRTAGKVLRTNACGTGWLRQGAVWRAHLAAVLLQQRDDLHVVPPHSILQMHFLVNVGCASGLQRRSAASYTTGCRAVGAGRKLLAWQIFSTQGARRACKGRHQQSHTARGVRPNLSTGDAGTRSTLSSHLHTW